MVVVSFILISLVLILLQTTICMLHPTWLLAPDFYYILVAYLAYRFDLLRGLVILFPLGCMLDVFSGIILGTYSILCFGGYFILRLMSKKLPVNESLYQVPLIGVSYLFVSWLVYLLLGFIEPGALVPWSWWKMIVRVTLIVVFALPFFRFFEVVKNRMQSGIMSLKKLRVRTSNRYRQE